jgi:hypothetical protein
MHQLQGMGQTGLIIGGVAAVVLSVIAIAGTYVFLQIWREEREYSEQNPVQSTIQSSTKAILAVMGLGVVAVGGLMYWDYRRSITPYGRGVSPFEGRPSRARADRGYDELGIDRLATDAKRLKGEARQMVAPKSTRKDPALERWMEEERGIQDALEADRGASRRVEPPWPRGRY